MNARPLLGIGHYFVDLALICATLILTTFTVLGRWPDQMTVFVLVTILAHGAVFALHSYYLKAFYESRNRVVFRLFSAWSLMALAILSIGFITKSGEQYSRAVILSWAFITPALLYVSLFVIRYIRAQTELEEAKIRRSIIVGTDAHARDLERQASKVRSETFIGSVQVPGEEEAPSVTGHLLGRLENLRDIVKGNRVRRVYIALGLEHTQQVQAIQYSLLDLNVDVIWAPDVQSFNLINLTVTQLGSLPMIALNQSPLTSAAGAAFIKAAMDRVLALGALIALSPIMIPVAIAVKMSSPGPIIFKQNRTGFDGKVIRVWKFRSMKMHEEKEGEVKQAQKDDNRITKVGAFIRKTSIDELPQLVNVLQGTMSMVGPRPHAVAHNNFYSQKIDAYLARHRMKPGITGLAQVNGFRGETDTLDKMQKRIDYDLEYINTWSLWLDIKILVMTPISLVRDEAY